MSRTKGYKCSNVYCGSCRGESLCGESGDSPLQCPDRLVPGPTNADRIRAMSDEELAAQPIVKVDGLTECSLFLSLPIGKLFVSGSEAERATLKWLQQPAEEGD